MATSKDRKRPAVPSHFPKGLWPGKSGRWECKIAGVKERLALWGEPEKALKQFRLLKAEAEYKKQKGEKYNGGTRGYDVDKMLSGFLEQRQLCVGMPTDKNGIGERTYLDEKRCKQRLCSYPVPQLGGELIGQVRIEHISGTTLGYFANALPIKKWGRVHWNNHIGLFWRAHDWAKNAGLIEKPIARHQLFEKRKKTKGKHKQWELSEIHTLYNAYSSRRRYAMAAMLLLAINAGFHNIDFTRLQLHHIEGEFIMLRRGKTGQVLRCCWLWPETRAAIELAIKHRPEPKKGFVTFTYFDEEEGEDVDEVIPYESLIFLTCNGVPWVSPLTDRDAVGKDFIEMRKELGVFRKGVGFHTIRRTFKSLVETELQSRSKFQTCDFPAINWVMGHLPGDAGKEGAGTVYRYFKSGDEERCKHVCEVMRELYLAAKPAEMPALPTSEFITRETLVTENEQLHAELAELKRMISLSSVA